MAEGSHAIKCAHCKQYHATVTDVKFCAQVNGASRTLDPVPVARPASVTIREQAKRATVPDGHYAVDDKGILKFFRVVRPTEGKWAGRVFVDQQVSDEYHPTFAYAQRNYILGLIATQGVRECSVRYGHELGRCGVCNRTLTNKASRQAGIGPICAGRLA